MTEPLVVVGGGVVGCAVAREAAADRDVILVERDDVASGATGRAAGLDTLAADFRHLPEIAAAGTTFLREYDGTRGFEYAACPGLELVERGGEPSDAADELRAGGIDAEHLDAGETGALHPGLETGALAGSLAFAGTGWFDPPTYARALRDDAIERGATVRTGTSCTGIRTGDGRVTGVETTDGTVPAGAVVAAAGWRTADLVADHLALPVRPYRTQVVVLPTDGDWRDRPLGWSPADDVYFRPTREGNLLVGGGSAPVENPADAPSTADPGFRESVAPIVDRLFRGVESAAPVGTWAGVDGATPDTYPIIDAPDDAPEGLVLATGFHGRGVMLAAVAAKLVRSFVAGEPRPFRTGPFALERFGSRSPDFEFYSASA